MKYVFQWSVVFFSEHVIRWQSQNVPSGADGSRLTLRSVCFCLPSGSCLFLGRFDKEDWLQGAQNGSPLLMWWVTVCPAKRVSLGFYLDVLTVVQFGFLSLTISTLTFFAWMLIWLWQKCKLIPKLWVLRLKVPLLFEMLYFTHQSILQILSREIVWCVWI